MLSIKQKQVLGVTSIVVLVVVSLSGLQLVSLTRTLVQQSRDRGEFIAMTIGHSAQDVVVSEESAFQDLRRVDGRASVAGGGALLRGRRLRRDRRSHRHRRRAQ